MARKAEKPPVRMAFEEPAVHLAIADIRPLRLITAATRATTKYAQIAASMREVGLVEPLVVARDRPAAGEYLLLDGHLRLDILQSMGETDVLCLVSTDDEAFTYNRRISRIAIIQEHRMILAAVERGVSQERIAKALNVNVATLRHKIGLLSGICPEAVELLKDKHVSTGAFWVLKRMAPLRQIEAAELMVAMNRYTTNYAKALLAATPESQLNDARKPKVVTGLGEEQLALMERESANLEREFRMAEQSYGKGHLDLVLAKGYLTKLLGNARVVRYLGQHHHEILVEFQKMSETERSAA